MRSRVFSLLMLAALLIVIATLSLGIGAVRISPKRVIAILFQRDDSATNAMHTTIIWELRMPRVCLACFIGMALGSAGAGYQGLFRNPLADPFVIGASSGAALGATIVIISGVESSAFGVSALPAAALAGSLLTVAMVYGIANVGRQASLFSLLLAGVAMSSFIGAVVSLLMFLHDEQLITIFG